MGYYTQFTVDTPDEFMALFEKDEEVEAHIKSLKDKGLDVELNFDDFKRNITKDVEITFDRKGNPYFYADGYGFYHYEDGRFYNSESAKFYQWQAVFTKLSEKVDGLFVVEGDGEESGDLWRAYFRGGKSYVQKPVFPEFDPEKLT